MLQGYRSLCLAICYYYNNNDKIIIIGQNFATSVLYNANKRQSIFVKVCLIHSTLLFTLLYLIVTSLSFNFDMQCILQSYYCRQVRW